MEQIPDAPWIREAERDGMPQYDEPPPVYCPLCGEECEEIFVRGDDDEVVGCENCVHSRDAYQWREWYGDG